MWERTVQWILDHVSDSSDPLSSPLEWNVSTSIELLGADIYILFRINYNNFLDLFDMWNILVFPSASVILGENTPALPIFPIWYKISLFS